MFGHEFGHLLSHQWKKWSQMNESGFHPPPLPLPRARASFPSMILAGEGFKRQKRAERAKDATLSPFLPIFLKMSDLLFEFQKTRGAAIRMCEYN